MLKSGDCAGCVTTSIGGEHVAPYSLSPLLREVVDRLAKRRAVEVVTEHLDLIILASVDATCLEVATTVHDAKRPCMRSTCGLSMLCRGGAGSVNAVFTPLFTPTAGGGSALLWTPCERTRCSRDEPGCYEIPSTSPCRWLQRRLGRSSCETGCN